MTKTLALRPKGKHPLHMLREFEIWPLDEIGAVPGPLRERVLAGLPRLDRNEVPWNAVSLRSDRALQEIFHTEERIGPADVRACAAACPASRDACSCAGARCSPAGTCRWI